MNRHLIYYIAAAMLLASCTDHTEHAMDHYAQALRLLDSGDAPEALRQLEQADQLPGSALIVLLLLMLLAWIYASRRRRTFRMMLEQLELMLDKRHLRQETAPADQLRIITQTEIYKRIQQLLSEHSTRTLADDEWQLLGDTLDKVYPDFTRRLESFCRMSTHERRLCQLLKLGLPPSAIADLTARTRQAVSNTRKRLYEKAFGRKGSSDEWDAFIDSL